MSEPRDLVERLEAGATLPDGSEERFWGYGVMGFPSVSGHVLGLRRFPASSLGTGYTSVWHRDPDGVWTFYQDAPASQSCARYFGTAIAEELTVDIKIDWTGPQAFNVAIQGRDSLDWQVSLSSAPQTRVMNAMGKLLPEALWRQPAVLKLMGILASVVLGAGSLGLTGRVPNGQRFLANPRLIWFIESGNAVVNGSDLGPIGPLAEQASLADFRIPQRGLFVIGGAFFEPFDEARHASATSRVTAA